MTPSPKTNFLSKKIQEVTLSPEGNVLSSDDALIPLKEGSSIADIHPFFLGLIPSIQLIEDELDIPCVNIDSGDEVLIVDLNFILQDDTLYMLMIDMTDHYEASQPLVQEKNVASLEKYRLAFEKRLLQAKEEFKNSFLANLNHEIRNPLNNLLGFMEVLKESKLDYDQNETLKVMQKTGTHIKILMDDLLDISKIERGVLELKHVNFNLGHVLTNLQNHFDLKYHGSPIEFEIDLNPNVPRKLIGDPARLNQILFNLIENAFRNTESGQITVAVNLVNKKKDDARISLEVSDSGIGIPSDKIDQVFDSYFQLHLDKMKPIGEGLGLKIVKDLTESMSGKVEVVSTEGKGTSFSVELPFKIRKGDRAKKTVPKGSGVLLSKRILFVENETTNQMLFIKFFLNNEKGYVVEIASSGEHAMQLLGTERYSLVVFRLQLPDMTGFDLIEKIRNHESEKVAGIPIMIASGSTLIEEQEAVYDAGASDFLPKPYSKAELFKHIDKLID